ncbi:LuxR C-terminal-related transcriptional regulator [Paenibacillus montanisoli]|uniref:HTH luxR-type domain-containing protein n=1 Tax=Paenibacillus montanisoli TaxID=2081970 RepID=A0A328U0E4_9BACL|nr:LuxR C-terminal-related transcriptional regulator [Paenibacillus montanisoli]RAP73436.1 hypothetical protein DL346_27435 [Paenibacillus montanisoli]
MRSFGEEIRRLEERFFVGRRTETELFRNFVFDAEGKARILNISGTGGIGKSSLLDQFRRICDQEGIPFFHMDCLDFTKTQRGFASRLLAVLNAEAAEDSREEELLQEAVQRLNHLAVNSGLVFAIDTYEEMNELDDWLRQSFLVRLSHRIRIVLSGRFPLKGGWVSSPAWRRLIKFVPLSPFDYETCEQYTSIYGDYNGGFVRKSYMMTKGHPLTLSLFMGLNESDAMRGEQEPEPLVWNETFREIAGQWLREIPDPALRELLEAVTMVRVFNQEILETMLEKVISNAEFEKLIQLSFVRKSERGWYLHQVLRKALYQDFRQKKPQIYHRLWQRSVKYHYTLAVSRHVSMEERNLLMMDFIYIAGAPGFRAMFYDDAIDQSYYIETVHRDHVNEAEQYVRDCLANLEDYVQEMYDPVSNEKYIYRIPKAVNERWFTSIKLSEIMACGNDAVRLLKNEKHEAVGMFIYIPIHRDSLRLLELNPITQSYFRSLSRTEREKLLVPPESPAGWFQYMIDFSMDGSASARFMFFQTYLSYYLKGGIMVYTAPMKYNQEAVKGIGYVEVPKAAHKGFGPDFPAPVFVLDFREDREMKKFAENLYRSALEENETAALDPILSKLTPREREIALLTRTCSSNLEIAQKLYLSEITVKKCLSRIYEKLEVKGKSELVKKLMS